MTSVAVAMPLSQTELRRPSRGQVAYAEIRTRILDNQWPPGTTMLEREIADQLNMSRTPVREALIRLQEERLVEVIPRHGMRVLPVSAADMAHIYQVLSSLEATAAATAAQLPRNDDRLAELQAATDAMEAALAATNLTAWAKADEQFHRLLVAMSGNPYLMQTVNRFWDMAHRARMLTLALRSIPSQSTSEHRQLCQAIMRGDAEQAARLHQAHRERGIPEITRILKVIEQTQETL